MIKMYCPGCGSFQPLQIDPMLEQLWCDIICPRCRTSMATVQVDKKGIYEIKLKEVK